MHADERAASEVVGSVLLVAVVVLTVTTLTAAVLFDDALDDDPHADVAVNVTDQRVTVNHTGGEALDADRVSVVVRYGGDEFRADGLDDVGDRFGPGEGWVGDHSADLPVGSGDRVRVVVVHGNRTVLFDAERRVYPG